METKKTETKAKKKTFRGIESACPSNFVTYRIGIKC